MTPALDKPSTVELLRVVLAEDSETETLQWHAFDASFQPAGQGSGSLEELPPCRSLHWILPAGVIAGHLIPIPAGSSRQQSQIIDQALEDILLTGRDGAHVVLAGQYEDGRLVWVCSKAWLSAWLERWKTGPAPLPEAAYPIHDLLPESSRVTFAATEQGFVFRSPHGQTGCLDDESLLPELLGHDAERVDDLLSRPLLPQSGNLLTGPFAIRSPASLKPAQFRRSAWLAGSLAMVVLLGSLIHWQKLESREKKLKDEIRQTFAATFPGTPIIDPFMQWESMKRERAGNGAGSDALDHLTRSAAMLSGIQPRSAEFRDGVVRLVVSETDLVAARNRLQQDGQSFDVSPAETGFSRLDIRIPTR